MLYTLYRHTISITFLGKLEKMDGVPLVPLFFVLQVSWLGKFLEISDLFSQSFFLVMVENYFLYSGAEAMFADLGHFSKLSVRVIFLNILLLLILQKKLLC